VEDLQALATQLYGERDPAERFVERRPIRMSHAHGRPRIELDLPGASKEELRVEVRGADLWIRVRDASRVVALPDVMVGRAVAHARLENEVLEVAFA
jgi:arsenite-transporting ATPase